MRVESWYPIPSLLIRRQQYKTAYTITSLERKQHTSIQEHNIKHKKKNRAKTCNSKYTKNKKNKWRKIHHRVWRCTQNAPPQKKVQNINQEVTMLQNSSPCNNLVRKSACCESDCTWWTTGNSPFVSRSRRRFVANVRVLRVGRGGRIFGQVKRTYYAMLENGGAPHVTIRKD